MKISNRKSSFWWFLLVLLLVSGCDDEDDIDVTVTFDEIIEPPPLGMVGSESDRMINNNIEHIIHISVDGLHGAAITALGNTALPGFYYLRENGSYTDNARTDDQIVNTLPNHTSQFSGRYAYGFDGHNMITNNHSEESEKTLHSIKGSYVASIFDMVHDFGLSTALYTGKSKFSLFEKSWNEANGAIDRVSPDSGRNKIDTYVFEPNTSLLVDAFIGDLEINQYNYAFLHIKDPDVAGHDVGWSLEIGSSYLDAVEAVDVQISKIINFIQTDSEFTGTTVLVITADHGGEFGTNTHYLSFTNNEIDSGVIPFYIFGTNVPSAMDLYSWNPGITYDPGMEHPLFVDDVQPIRNGDVANLCMELLGLPNIPNSRIDNLSYLW